MADVSLSDGPKSPKGAEVVGAEVVDAEVVGAELSIKFRSDCKGGSLETDKFTFFY